MADEFWIKEVKLEEPKAVLEIGGRLGVNPAKDLRSYCAELRDKGFTQLELDMSKVTFISSSGVGALVVLSGECSIKGGNARLVNVSQPVMRAVNLLNLGRFLSIEQAAEPAVTASPQGD